MKVIDKTPLQNEKGEISGVQRLRGTLEFGLSWYAELEAQKAVMAQLDRVLEKGFALVRNVTLGRSQITEPLVLIGPAGIYVIYVITLSGMYEAKGDEWNQLKSGHSYPLAKNPMMHVARLAKALQVYLDKQGISLPGPVEPVLMASSPALHIETLRPMVRVVLSDAIRQFAGSLLQARPILKAEMVFDIADRIVTPKAKGAPAEPTEPEEFPPGYVQTEDEESAPVRARAIFHAAEENKPFDPADLNFDFDPNAQSDVPENMRETSPSQQLPSGGKRGLSARQLIVLAVMGLVECCVLAGFAYLIISSTR
jgi:nuclease-like protein